MRSSLLTEEDDFSSDIFFLPVSLDLTISGSSAEDSNFGLKIWRYLQSPLPPGDSHCSLWAAGEVGRPRVGMAGMESSPLTLGAKLTVLKEGGGGRGSSGKLSITVKFIATLRLFGTLQASDPGWDSAALVLSSVLMKARVFLVLLSHKRGERTGEFFNI